MAEPPMDSSSPEMFPRQGGFLRQVREELDRFLRDIDPRLTHRTFLLGVYQEEQKRFSVFPNDCPIAEKAFANIFANAEEFAKADPRSNESFIEGPIQRLRMKRINEDAIRKASLQAVKVEDYISFCSSPKDKANCQVMVITQIPASQYLIFPHLLKANREVPNCPAPVTVWTSFLEAAVDYFLDETIKSLDSPTAGLSFPNVDDRLKVLRDAAKRFLDTAAYAAGNQCHPSFFEVCNVVATMKHEGKEPRGKIVIARKDHPHVEMLTEFAEPIAIESVEITRKMLQTSFDKTHLISDTWEIYGLGLPLETYDPINEDLFIIEFAKHGLWKLLHSDKTLMNVFYGEPLIALREFPEAKFKLDATRIFPSASKEGIERLVEFGKELLKIQHGGMLAITADAAIEADRLDSQCIRVRPFPITPDLLSALTKMDGALLIDPEGTCHALGVILDGRASKLCDSSRGSRYNSAIRYVIGDNNIKAMAIVKSEDGMLDVIPDLHPKIRRSEVRNAFQILQALAAQKEPDSEELSRT